MHLVRTRVDGAGDRALRNRDSFSRLPVGRRRRPVPPETSYIDVTDVHLKRLRVLRRKTSIRWAPEAGLKICDLLPFACWATRYHDLQRSALR